MEKNNDKKLVKVVLESYVIRNEEGVGLYRTSTREGAERQLNSFCECYGQPLPFKPSITKERAIVECEVVRRRYSKSCRNPAKAGMLITKHNITMKAQVTETFSNTVLRRIIVLRTIKKGFPPLSREVAGVLNWTPPRLSLVKSGLCRMTPDDMQKLAEWVGVDMESLATSEDFARVATEAARQINY